MDLLRHRRGAGPLALAVLFSMGAGACNDAESREAPRAERPEARATRDPAPDARSATLPAGATLDFTLDESVSTETHAEGDHFTGTLLSVGVRDAHDAGSDLEGARSRWTITRASPVSGQPMLAVELDAIETGHRWVPVRASVIDVELPERPQAGEEEGVLGSVGWSAPGTAQITLPRGAVLTVVLNAPLVLP